MALKKPKGIKGIKGAVDPERSAALKGNRNAAGTHSGHHSGVRKAMTSSGAAGAVGAAGAAGAAGGAALAGAKLATGAWVASNAAAVGAITAGIGAGAGLAAGAIGYGVYRGYKAVTSKKRK